MSAVFGFFRIFANRKMKVDGSVPWNLTTVERHFFRTSAVRAKVSPETRVCFRALSFKFNEF